MNLSKWTLAALGWTFLFIGVVGIFVPLLPTTPFLILATLCFSRSSEKVHNWILNHKTLGPPVRDWNERRAIALRHKSTATLLIALSSAFVLTSGRIPDFGKIGYSLFMTSVLIFIWTRNSK